MPIENFVPFMDRFREILVAGKMNVLSSTVRYVTLPSEAHGYAARETLLDVLAERINWFDRYVKSAGPRVADGRK